MAQALLQTDAGGMTDTVEALLTGRQNRDVNKYIIKQIADNLANNVIAVSLNIPYILAITFSLTNLISNVMCLIRGNNLQNIDPSSSIDTYLPSNSTHQYFT